MIYQSKQKNSQKKSSQSNQKGQIVVEYVLLLVLSIGIALLVVSYIVSRDPSSPGFLISKWYEILSFIASDLADDIL